MAKKWKDLSFMGKTGIVAAGLIIGIGIAAANDKEPTAAVAETTTPVEPVIAEVAATDQEEPAGTCETAKYSAYNRMVMLVEDVLKAPETATFSRAMGQGTQIDVISSASSDDKCTYRVEVTVDSQNSFGAMIRTKFSSGQRYTPSTGEWDLIYFTDSPLN